MMKLKVYTSVDGKRGELLDEVEMPEMQVVAFCYDSWPEHNTDVYNYDLPDWKRRPPFEIERPDGSLLAWDVPTRQELEGDDEEDEDDDGSPIVLDTSVQCQRCGSHRVCSANSHGKDLNTVSIGNKERCGYLPDDLGIGGGDDLEIDYCLECGQIQGTWPIPPSKMEKGR